jgi:GMP synthase PP-ATPase subunit
MKYIIVLIIILLLLSIKSGYDDVMTTIRAKYALLREELQKRNMFPMIWKEGIITGMNEISSDGVGYNVGKGYEIFICIKGGDTNDIMHVLLHELAHNTVSEYDHSSKFWSNLDEIKKVAKEIGIYKHTPNKAFCDGIISD